MYQENKYNYKKINIQNLQKREQRPVIKEKIEGQHPLLIQSIGRWGQYKDFPVLCYQDSGLGSERLIEKDSRFSVSHFFNAFANAYEKHGDIVLIPDEIWIMISFFISKYIDRNAEKLRYKLVKHKGVKKIIVKQFAQTVGQSLQMEKNWDNFFDEIIKSIKKQTVEGVVQAFQCNFTTTNKTYQVVSTSIIMNSMKRFFRYQRNIGFLCGINNVYMAGTREDWAKMIPKLEDMIQFDVDGDIKQYVSHMKIILSKFLDTFDEKPDVQWWNTIMTTPQKRSVYFSTQMPIEGWILNFFGMYERQVLQGFPQMNISVPIILKNQLTGKQKELELLSDFVSVSKLDDHTYKPDVGVVIFEMNSKPLNPSFQD